MPPRSAQQAGGSVATNESARLRVPRHERQNAAPCLLLLVGSSCATSPPAKEPVVPFDEQWAALLASDAPAAARERFRLAVAELKRPGGWQPRTKRDAVIHQSDRDARAALREAPSDVELARDLVEFKIRVGSRPALAAARCHLAALEGRPESWRACGNATMGNGRTEDVARAHCRAAVLNPTEEFVRPCLTATRDVPSLIAAAGALCQLANQPGQAEALRRCIAIVNDVDEQNAKDVAQSVCAGEGVKSFDRIIACGDAHRSAAQVSEALTAYRAAFTATVDRTAQFRAFERIEQTSTTPQTELSSLAPELVPLYQEWKRRNEDELREQRRVQAERETRRQDAAALAAMHRKGREEDLAIIRKSCLAKCSAESTECSRLIGAGTECIKREWACEAPCSAYAHDPE